MSDKEIPMDEKSWVGKKGFDEAQYYNNDKYEIGFSKSDESIRQKVLETAERLGENIEVKVEDGHVTLTGKVKHAENTEELPRTISGFSGVKEIQNNLLC
ncbi:MAG: BON domain-containing protein [Bacteriovoracia bacterium]